MKNTTTIKATANVTYRERISALKQKPSASKQFKIWIESKSEGNEIEKRFFAAWTESEKAKAVNFGEIWESVQKRYKNGINDAEKYISTYFWAQVCDKQLQNIMTAQCTNENLRKCIAKYFRALIIAKSDGAILVNETGIDINKPVTTTTEKKK